MVGAGTARVDGAADGCVVARRARGRADRLARQRGAGGGLRTLRLPVQPFHTRDVGLQLADAVGSAGVAAEEAGAALALAGGHHLVPQADAGIGVVGAARGHLQAHQVGLGLVVAAVFQAQQLGADVGAQLAQLPQPEQRGRHRQPQPGGLRLGDALAGVFAQRVGHLVAHDHGDFMVAQLQLVEDAAEEGDLAAGHAVGVDLLAADEVDLPAPAAGAVVPLRGVRDQPAGNAAQAAHLGVVVGAQRALGAGLGHQLAVFLLRGLFQGLGRHQGAQRRRAPHVHLPQHRRRRSAAGGQQEGAARRPHRTARGLAGGGRERSLGVAEPEQGG